MSENNVSRRSVLAGVGGGVAATAAGAGVASGSERVRINVGTRVSPKAADAEKDPGIRAATRMADEVVHQFGFEAMTIKAPRGVIENLRRNPGIRYAEIDPTAEALDQTTAYGVDITEADLAIENGETGDGADVAVIDTGVDATHEDLKGHLGKGKAIATCEENCEGGFFCSCNGISNCNEPWDDDNDHGSHCSGIVGALNNSTGVLGVAPDVTIHPVKVLDACGSGQMSDIAAGIEWVADQGYDVASMSLGGSSSSTLKDAVEYASQEGVLLVAAAGNDGPCSDCVGHPAAYDEVIAVSSTDSNDDLSDFSSTGPEIEIAAPGTDILSSVPRSDYTEFSGTSMACPHVAGAGGQLMANGLTAAEARTKLKNSADDIGLASNEQGDGRLNVASALGIDDGGDDPDPEPSLEVSTGSATGVGTNSATLNGSLDDLGGASSADVYFEYGSSSLSNTTSTQTLSSTGSFSADVSGLSSDTTYDYRAVADASDGDSAAGATSSFTTDSDDGGFCFITTATAGEGETLDSLRRFRDESMAATPVGSALVDLYYRISPPIAETLGRYPESRTSNAVRKLVDLCADLSDAQDETDSRVESAALGVTLTNLYMVGITVAAAGHTGIRAREMLGL